MKTLNRILLVSAVGLLGACASTAPYYYDDYYAYYPAAYDDYYYDATMASGYYYYPSAYYYGYQTKAASVNVVPPSVRLLLQRWAAPIDPTCLTATTAGDADGDGIDADSTITFQCSSNAAGGSAQVTGSVTVRDLDDTAADAGFSITFNGFSVRVVTGTGALTERVVNGTETAQKVGTQLRLIRDVVTNATDTFPDSVQRQSKLEMRSQGLLTPDVVAGSAIVTRGTLVLSGQGTFTGPDGVGVTLARRTDPSLHWNNDCTTVPGNQGPYDSGAIIFTSSRGRETRIVHSSCASLTVTNTIVPAQ